MNKELLSDRVNNLSESETLKMTQKSRELKALGNDVITLSIGEPDFNTPDSVKEAAIKAINKNMTHYTPVPGYQELREAISKKFKRDNNLDYKPEQIVVSGGAKQSIANAMLCLVNPGDEVIVPAPYWVSYPEIVKLAEGKVIYINAGVETDFKFTAQQLEKVITSRSKVLLFSSPCNPTGSVYSKEELQAIAAVVAKHKQLFVISDEIYEFINFKGKHESMAQFEEIKEQVVTINGVSKGYAMTGWRIGYMAAPTFLAKACIKLQGQYTSGASSIAQAAAMEAVLQDPAESKDMKNMIQAFHERRDLVIELIKEIPGLKTNVPDGAFYVFPEADSYFGKSYGKYQIKNAEDLCMYILETEYVGLVSGGAFGNEKCIRISYATSKELITEALTRIKRALSKLK